jgi:hypothetical protein
MNKRIISLVTCSLLLFIALPIFAVQLPNYGASDFSSLIGTVATEVGTVIAGIATIMFIISGILFVASTTNPELRNTAKKALTYAVIGIVVGLSANAIVNFIKGFF